MEKSNLKIINELEKEYAGRMCSLYEEEIGMMESGRQKMLGEYRARLSDLHKRLSTWQDIKYRSSTDRQG